VKRSPDKFLIENMKMQAMRPAVNAAYAPPYVQLHAEYQYGYFMRHIKVRSIDLFVILVRRHFRYQEHSDLFMEVVDVSYEIDQSDDSELCSPTRIAGVIWA
jgi:hypothetical protein